MEVATIITSSKDIISLFDRFIYSYTSLCLRDKDTDTVIFKNVLDDRERIYYHYELNDPEKEFSYNYPEEEVAAIKAHFGRKKILMFGLQYSTENLLSNLLRGFKESVIEYYPELLPDILISHPFDGLKKLEIDY